VEHLGDQNHLHVMLADTAVVVLADPDSPLHVGDAVALQPESPLFFGADGGRLRH
jgi:multiple sugar transport system ATP-binding protein